MSPTTPTPDGPPPHGGPVERIHAIRGAITLDEDSKEEVLVRTAQMLGEILSRNELHPSQLVSLLFTATEDVTAEFPAAAVRKAGISDVPMMCARELGIVGESNIPLCIRVMAHVYTARPRTELRHAYLRGARQLRSDLPE